MHVLVTQFLGLDVYLGDYLIKVANDINNLERIIVLQCLMREAAKKSVMSLFVALAQKYEHRKYLNDLD